MTQVFPMYKYTMRFRRLVGYNCCYTGKKEPRNFRTINTTKEESEYSAGKTIASLYHFTILRNRRWVWGAMFDTIGREGEKEKNGKSVEGNNNVEQTSRRDYFDPRHAWNGIKIFCMFQMRFVKCVFYFLV